MERKIGFGQAVGSLHQCDIVVKAYFFAVGTLTVEDVDKNGRVALLAPEAAVPFGALPKNIVDEFPPAFEDEQFVEADFLRVAHEKVVDAIEIGREGIRHVCIAEDGFAGGFFRFTDEDLHCAVATIPIQLNNLVKPKISIGRAFEKDRVSVAFCIFKKAEDI